LSNDTSNSLAIRTLALGATAQLREVIKTADRETARPIYDELIRIANTLAWKHDFRLQRKKQEDHLCQIPK
jgi:hypothetical protein